MENQREIEIWRIVLAIIFPPLAVLDRGCGTALLVFVLTMVGWFPGIAAALVLIVTDKRVSMGGGERRFVEIPGGRVTVMRDSRYVDVPAYDEDDEPKRKGAFIHLEDGEIAEVVEDDGALPEKRKNDGGVNGYRV